MRKFQFKFESVETVRKSKENESLRALGEAQRALQAAKERKNSLVRALDASMLRRELLGSEPVSPVAFRTETDFIEGSKQRIKQAEQGILRANRGVEKALRAYLHARRQTRMMEILREKALEEHKRERLKHEQKELDDLYVMRARSHKETA